MRNSSGRACSACLDVGVREPVERLGLSGLQARGGVRGGPGQLPVLDLFGTGPLRLALLLAVAVDEGVGQDPEQPGLQVRARLELVEGRIRLGEGLLDQVLGIGRVAGHPHPRRSRADPGTASTSCSKRSLRSCSVSGTGPTSSANARCGWPKSQLPRPEDTTPEPAFSRVMTMETSSTWQLATDTGGVTPAGMPSFLDPCLPVEPVALGLAGNTAGRLRPGLQPPLGDG